MAYLKCVSKSEFFSVKLSYGVKNTAWEPSILYHLVFYAVGSIGRATGGRSPNKGIKMAKFEFPYIF